MTLSRLLQIGAWILLIGLVVVTIEPIQFRPISALPVQLERSLAVGLIGFVFALAYPRHIVAVAFVVLGATVLLELLQVVTPTRHGRFADAVAKLIGGVGGLALGYVVNRVRHRS
jgi:VanZ family protein